MLLGLPLFAQSTAPPEPQQTPALGEGLQNPAPQVAMLPLDTSSPEQLEEQGDRLRAHNLHLDALDSYRAAIRKAPTPVLYNKVGITLILLRRPIEAEESINHAIKLQ